MRALQRKWGRTRIRERNALHRVSASIARSHNRIAIADLQVSNMMRDSNWPGRWPNGNGGTRRATEQQAESAGGEVVRVFPRHTALNILLRGIALAERDIGSSSRSGGSESVLDPHVSGLPGQDAERYTAD